MLHTCSSRVYIYADVLPRAAETNYHRLGSLNNRNQFSHHSGGWDSEIRGPAWLGSGEKCLPGSQTAAPSLRPHMVESKPSLLMRPQSYQILPSNLIYA